MGRPLSVVCQVGPGDYDAAWRHCAVARQLELLGVSAGVLTDDPLALRLVRDYGVFAAATSDLDTAEVLFRTFAPGSWPTPPSHLYPVDYVFEPSRGSSQCRATIALFHDEPDQTTGPVPPPPEPPLPTPGPGTIQVADARTVVADFLAPIPVEVYTRPRRRTKKRFGVCLGTDPLDRTAGLVAELVKAQYPRVDEANAGLGGYSAATALHVFDLPGDVNPGDVVIMWCAFYPGPSTVTWPTGWTVLCSDQTPDTRGQGGATVQAVWRRAQLYDPKSVGVRTSEECSSAFTGHTVRQAQADPVCGPAQIINTETPTAPTLDLGAIPEDQRRVLWLACTGHESAVQDDGVISFPTNYFGGQRAKMVNVGVGTAYRYLEATSEGGAQFTLGKRQDCVTRMIALPPGPSGETATGVIIPREGGTEENPLPAIPNVSESFRFFDAMQTADVAVCAPGVFADATASLGIPTLVVSATDEERRRCLVVDRTAAREHQIYQGDLRDLDDLAIHDSAVGLIEAFFPLQEGANPTRTLEEAAALAIQLTLSHAGRQNLSFFNTSRIARWVAQYVLGTRAQPFGIPGYDTLLPGIGPAGLPPLDGICPNPFGL